MNFNRAIGGSAPTGFVVSFTGSLGPGVVTLGVLQTSLERGPLDGFYFSIGSVGLEGAVIWATLAGASWLFHRQAWMRWLEWFSFFVILGLAVGAGWGLFFPKSSDAQPSLLALPPIAPFWAGFAVRLLTPTMIPYWLGWNMVVLSKKLIPSERSSYFHYTWGAIIGTLAAHGLFIALGAAAAQQLKGFQQILQWITFSALSIIALGQFWKLRG